MGKKWLTDQQKIEIVEKYRTGKYTCSSLGRLYNRDNSSIGDLLRRRGVIVENNQSKLKRKYFCNDNYFDLIDSEEKAYFLGLLYADGCIYNNKLIIGLTEQDKHILDEFKEKIEYDGPLSYVKQKIFKGSKTYVGKPMYRLVITSNSISNSLIKLGCVPAKSLILRFPTDEQVPRRLIKHFIRGYFDGDGSIIMSLTKDGYNKYSVDIASAKQFCQELQQLLTSILDINIGIGDASNKNGITQIVRIRGYNIFKFLDWIYEDATIFLKRKYNKYLMYKENYEQEPDSKSYIKTS